ncbi:isoleucine--tRNA ligase [Fischerella thermalis CCMEE 5330]|uniref:Isoleucine--tRNA ligase n=1 Tax=Fischerella thermalis CCMEE 5330 TaxID=2019670 RepID=A0A2N6M5D6_9CYAN|nr:isoleucine--tRNA ligase [Fischerella thermalis]PMB42015.1 isoleucine--tRNA ligase [Fischerella thermalis CCMEE 5330]
MFREVEKNLCFPSFEQEVIDFWKTHHIFQKSVEKDAPQGNYVFYEGPPTANGKPGVHHVISRAYKDLFLRYKTMQGYRVERKGGWDTHGLPVELEVEKKLGFTKKADIEAFGIARFNELCKQSVFERIQDWQAMTERIGYWLDLENAYITYENQYIESCWWLMKSLWERNLLFEDYRSTWHCPRNNTSLSDHEVAQGYRDVEDPSIYPKFAAYTDEIVKRGLWDKETQPVYLLAWTTTPWTLPANVALAVRADAMYGLFAAPPQAGDRSQTDLYILASSLANQVFGEGNYRTLKTFTGEALVGLHYQPLLQGYVPEGEDLSQGFRVVSDEQVIIDEGTGVLHIAPAYGDLELGRKYNLPMLFSVDLLGQVYPQVKLVDAPDGEGPYTGQFFKDADRQIIADLLDKQLLYRATTINHTYPFNYRDGTPLINYAKKSWYIRTTAVKDKLIANNNKIHWHPEYIRDGRFGDWLRNNIDWALSRERYWGAPLPVWVSEDESEYICVGSVKELAELTGRDLSGLDLHRPYIDEIVFEKNGKRFQRVPYTVDVWFESGAMPYAQWHYPFENQDVLAGNFPADYICEAIDQTRGWFYSLHALATLLTDTGGSLAHIAQDSPAFKNAIVLGHIVDEKGEKMSKSKGNTVNPWTVLDAQGADALRWYLYSTSPPENTKRFSQGLVEDTLRDFLMTLWNTYSFLVLYANLDQPDLQQDVPVFERPEIDRWLVSKVNVLIRDVTERLEAYDPTSASRAIRDFVVNDLSNWYVRRNRRRFWKSENDGDKLSAYKTLYETMVIVAKLMAPMAPFVSEHIYQNLVLSVFPEQPESVHLANWEKFDATLIDTNLLRDMETLIRIVELGRAARATAKVKIRQPLGEILVRVRNQAEIAGLQRLEEQLKEELNVKKVTYLDIATDLVDYTIKPNLPLVGKRLGKQVPALKKKLETIDTREIVCNIREGKETVIHLDGKSYHLEPEAFLIEVNSPQGYAAIEEYGYLAALNTQLTPELIQEGVVREAIRLLQEVRKKAGLNLSDRIHLGLETSGTLLEALKTHLEIVKNEVLAQEIRFAQIKEACYNTCVNINDIQLRVTLQKISSNGEVD